MAALDDVMQKAKEVAGAVGRAAGELVDDSRLKLQELKLSSELKDAYERLGSVVYDGIKSGEPNQALTDLVVGEIDSIRQSIEALKTSKAAPGPVEEKYCPQCGTTNGKDAVYCARCGAPLSMAAEPAPEEVPVPEEDDVPEEPVFAPEENGEE